MKPTLDRMVDMIVESLSGEAKDFYQREFSFFDEVTSISGKLKPFIKASKPEKKAKIDEEMANIKVDPGVYLPSNPDGVLVDINRTSGRPLQSHAKVRFFHFLLISFFAYFLGSFPQAPFMATFKVRRTRNKVQQDDLAAQDVLIDVEDAENSQTEEYDTWQSAIFKVGDDCRQDVLALQIIAIHKNIFNSLGLDLLVTPYRVTATGPGVRFLPSCPFTPAKLISFPSLAVRCHRCRPECYFSRRDGSCQDQRPPELLRNEVRPDRFDRLPTRPHQLHPVHGRLLSPLLHRPDQGPSQR
jgi:phosphatidylinositol 4-kinase